MKPSFIRTIKHYDYIPVKDELGIFSIAWTGHYPGESMLGWHFAMIESKNLHELK
jgi:hypothetical protein